METFDQSKNVTSQSVFTLLISSFYPVIVRQKSAFQELGHPSLSPCTEVKIWVPDPVSNTHVDRSEVDKLTLIA